MPSDTDNQRAGFVFTQSNEAMGNRLLVFTRDGDGMLTAAGSHETGGAGDDKPHLASQGSVVLTGDGRFVLVTNAASGELSAFTISPDGPSLMTILACGSAPKSVTEYGGLVYVLNTGDPSLSGFRLDGGRVEPIVGSNRALAADADPAQVGFSRDGAALVVTERGTNAVVSYPVDGSGLLGEPLVQPSSGPTPYGFAFTAHGVLVVTEAFGAQVGKAAASSYAISAAGLAPISRSVGNGRSEICWAVVTDDGRFAFTTNFADGAVSRYAIDAEGRITLDDAAAGLATDGRPGLRDEGLSADGRFLYAIHADSQQVYGWAVGAGGSLSPIGAFGRLPATVAGLAAS